MKKKTAPSVLTCIFDRMHITEKIWGYSFNSGKNVIDVHIISFRNKIDKGFPQKLISQLDELDNWLCAERELKGYDQ